VLRKRIIHYLSLRPVFEGIPTKKKKKFIPAGYKAVIIISADFELAWAWQHLKNSNDSSMSAIKKAYQARENIPYILDICDQYKIPITWFTVGHLFLDCCKNVNGIKHPEIKRLPYFENNYWRFNSGDWFDNAPCGDSIPKKAWHAPDLIKNIIGRKVKHEIGCHTFSHIDCRDEVCSSEVFLSEINACKQAAEKYGVDLKSFVHPAHTIGNIYNLIQTGFTSYRENSLQTIGYPELIHHKIWKFKSTMILNYTSEKEDFQIKRLKKIISRTVKHNAVANIWFHPSSNPKTFEVLLKELAITLNRYEREILVTNISDYCERLNNEFNIQ